MKKITITLLLILISIISQAQFQLNGWIEHPLSFYGGNNASIQIKAYPLGANIWIDPPISNVLCKNRNVTTNTIQINNTGYFKGLVQGTYLTCAFIGEDSLCYLFYIDPPFIPNIESKPIRYSPYTNSKNINIYNIWEYEDINHDGIIDKKDLDLKKCLLYKQNELTNQ